MILVLPDLTRRVNSLKQPSFVPDLEKEGTDSDKIAVKCQKTLQSPFIISRENKKNP